MNFASCNGEYNTEMKTKTKLKQNTAPQTGFKMHRLTDNWESTPLASNELLQDLCVSVSVCMGCVHLSVCL